MPLLVLALLLGTRGDTVVVSAGGPVGSLAEALMRVQPGGTVLLRAGIHRLTAELLVDRPVTIEGDGAAVLEGTGSHGLLRVTASGVSLHGLVFRNVERSFIDDRAAVTVDSAAACRIEDNRFERTFFGVYLKGARECRVVRNRLDGRRGGVASGGNGIHLWNSTGVTIEGNEVIGHRDGIYLEFTTGTRVSRNHSTLNGRYGLHFMFSHDCEYEHNVFEENGAGIAVMYSRRVAMRSNRFAGNWGPSAYGLLLKDIVESEITGNTFASNSVAMLVEGSSRLRVTGNEFSRNGWAVKLMANAEDNRFEGNRFTGNAFDVATNSRSNSSTFTGNSWDQYRGYDLDRDGYGDVPHRPVRFFSLVVQEHEPALILLRSFFVELLDLAERVLPILTPETLADARPRMEHW
ncbi:MAG TPA: nitrous oxide reductase family maturation protein NosD [Gemmatimonadales bacterium]